MLRPAKDHFHKYLIGSKFPFSLLDVSVPGKFLLKCISWQKKFLLLRHQQCDQIGQFNALWVTFQSLWQQLFCPNCLHYYKIFAQASKTSILSSEIIFGQLKQTLVTFYWSHCSSSTATDTEFQLPRVERIKLNNCLQSLKHTFIIAHPLCQREQTKMIKSECSIMKPSWMLLLFINQLCSFFEKFQIENTQILKRGLQQILT